MSLPADSHFGKEILANTPRFENSTRPVATRNVDDPNVVAEGLSAAMKSPSIVSMPLSSITGSLSVATAMVPWKGSVSACGGLMVYAEGKDKAGPRGRSECNADR